MYLVSTGGLGTGHYSASAAGLTYVPARFVLGRLPGLIGDVYGGINEVIEVMVLVAFMAL